MMSAVAGEFFSPANLCNVITKGNWYVARIDSHLMSMLPVFSALENLTLVTPSTRLPDTEDTLFAAPVTWESGHAPVPTEHYNDQVKNRSC